MAINLWCCKWSVDIPIVIESTKEFLSVVKWPFIGAFMTYRVTSVSLSASANGLKWHKQKVSDGINCEKMKQFSYQFAQKTAHKHNNIISNFTSCSAALLMCCLPLADGLLLIMKCNYHAVWRWCRYVDGKIRSHCSFHHMGMTHPSMVNSIRIALQSHSQQQETQRRIKML